jgi:replicative DNA helicase Mcm
MEGSLPQDEIYLKFEEFFQKFYKEELLEILKSDKKSLVIDFRVLDKFNHKLADELLAQPQKILGYADEIIPQLAFIGEEKAIKVRVKNIPQSHHIRIRDVRSEHIGKLIAITGLIRQTSDVRPEIVKSIFQCPVCNNIFDVPQTNFRYTVPNRCLLKECKQRGKLPEIDRVLTDMQTIKVEETHDSLKGSEQPARLDVILRGDLVDPTVASKVSPGTVMKICGILKDRPIFLRTGKSLRLEIYLDAISLEKEHKDFTELKISDKDVKKIKKLAKMKNIFTLISQSIAPTIYGHDMIKSAIALYLVGGVKKIREDGTSSRGDIHILLVGDPGAGKSQMLKFVSKIAPKAMYVAGKGASQAGLTATVVKDELLKGWTLEAGALVLANKGLVCIDELDKMDEHDRSSLHEAMEQQTVTVSKANIHATLMAEVGILAAANPKHGRFDPYTPIVDQFTLTSTILNRFDLIFPVQDIPDVKKDMYTGNHILSLHKDPHSAKPPIDGDLLRKYIAYAKQNYQPKLSDTVQKDLLQFYVGMRNPPKKDNDELSPVPITARQIDGLVRLAEAHAKLRLKETVDLEDVRVAKELLLYCLKQIGMDPETKKIDIDIVEGRTPHSRRRKMDNVRLIINDLEVKYASKKCIPRDEIIQKIVESKIASERDAEIIIDNMIEGGELFQPKRGYVWRV